MARWGWVLTARTNDLTVGKEVSIRMEENESLESQIGRLANFILAEVPEEPSRSEGAVDTAIRIIRRLQRESDSAYRAMERTGRTLDKVEASIDQALQVAREALSRAEGSTKEKPGAEG